MTTEGLPLAARMIEQARGKPLRDVILEDCQGMSAGEIAAAFGVSEVTLYRWLRRIGLRFERAIVADEQEANPPSV